MPRVYVSVGSNIERERNIRHGLHALRAFFGALTVSTVYESRAFGFEGDNFYNLVAGFDTDDELTAVIQALREIEEQHGRVRGGPRCSARTLDLDLLIYGNLRSHAPDITLPRAEIVARAFVLGPLAEIAGHLRDPLSGHSYRELWAQFDKDRQEIWPAQMDVLL